MAQQPLVGQGLLIADVSRSHSDTRHSVGLLWTSDRPIRRALYVTTHNTHKRPIPPPKFVPANPQIERPQAYVLGRVVTAIGTKSGIGICN